MRGRRWKPCLSTGCLAHTFWLISAFPTFAQPALGPEEFVQAGGVDIDVPGYSVPSFVHWDGDDREDLIVGEGGGGVAQGKVRVYLNGGTSSAPQFSGFFYAQSNGSDLVVAASGCLGAYPRVVYWDGDMLKDLLVGQADGTVGVYLNTGTDDDPSFDGGTLLQVGPAGSKTNIDVGSRATSTVVDWNNDGKKDLVVGALDGKIRVFLNEGTDTSPDFLGQIIAQAGGQDLVVPSGRSSPVIIDLNGDGKKDLLAGNTDGQLLFYRNTGSDAAPSFSGYTPVEADGVSIDLPGTPRSRHSVCDWTGDGVPDVLIGASDGIVRLYRGVLVLGDFDGDGDVDQYDADRFALCYTEPDGGPIEPGCERGDFDGDGDIDCDDWDLFVKAWTEPEPPPPPQQEPCANAIPTVSAGGLVAMSFLALALGAIVLRCRLAGRETRANAGSAT